MVSTEARDAAKRPARDRTGQPLEVLMVLKGSCFGMGSGCSGAWQAARYLIGVGHTDVVGEQEPVLVSDGTQSRGEGGKSQFRSVGVSHHRPCSAADRLPLRW